MMNGPNYRKIYSEILTTKFPDKKKSCESFLLKSTFTAIDIIRINEKIFGNERNYDLTQNQKHRSYHKSDIIKILHYQKDNKLNNSQLANHFNMSRNTIAKWKKLFQM